MITIVPLFTVLPGVARRRAGNVTFEDTFATLSLNDYGHSGVNWGAHFLGWGERYLQGNGDQAWKGGPDYRGAGGDTMAELGLACHEIVNGNLKLYGIQTPAEHKPQFYGFNYLGGMISSQNRHSQTYGIIECRAKFFASFGHHWAMWLVAADNSWPPEIDMVEILREDGNSYADNRMFMNRHRQSGVEPEDVPVTMYNGAIGFADGLPPYYPVADNAALADWHDYKFVWTPTVMEWHIDGLIRMSCPNYVNKPMYFMISPEIGGSWPKPTTANTVWPMEAEIEYVRWSSLDGIEETLYPNAVL